MTKKRTAWNKGLTKGMDARVAEIGRKSGASNSKPYAPGRVSGMKGKRAWNKGLTKETNQSVKRYSENTAKTKSNREYVASEESKIKRSDTFKKKKESVPPKACLGCNSDFKPGTYNQVFCNKECKINYLQNKENGLTCIICNKKLVGKQKRVCSDACGGIASSRIQKGRKLPPEVGMKISKKLKGLRRTSEHILKYKEAALKRGFTGKSTFFNTKNECKLKDILNQLNFNFQFQARILNQIVDFYIPTLNLIIESDGEYYHAHPDYYQPNFYNAQLKMTASEIREKDRKRTEELQKAGYKVLRIWAKDTSLEEVCQGIKSIV